MLNEIKKDFLESENYLSEFLSKLGVNFGKAPLPSVINDLGLTALLNGSSVTLLFKVRDADLLLNGMTSLFGNLHCWSGS